MHQQRFRIKDKWSPSSRCVTSETKERQTIRTEVVAVDLVA